MVIPADKSCQKKLYSDTTLWPVITFASPQMLMFGVPYNYEGYVWRVPQGSVLGPLLFLWLLSNIAYVRSPK